MCFSRFSVFHFPLGVYKGIMEQDPYILCYCTILSYIVHNCVCADSDYLTRLLKGHISCFTTFNAHQISPCCVERGKKRVLCILTLIQKLLTTLLISCIKVIPSNEASYEMTLQLHIVPGKLEQQGWTVIFTLNYTGERMKNHSFHWTLFSFYNYGCYHIFSSG